MKKQLLILVLAFFAINYTFGQGDPTQPPTCGGSASSPAIGVEYMYDVIVPAYTPNPGEGFDADGYYEWFVVVDNDANPTTPFDLLTQPIIPETDPDFTIATGAGYATYNDNINTFNPIHITWNLAGSMTDPYYLVIRYRETYEGGPTNCEPNNVKVYLITPQNTYWLKIENVADNTGTAGGDQICSPNVASATVTTTGTIDYDYGTTTHYVKISANGYTGDWTPEFQLPTLPVDMAYTSVTWTSTSTAGTATAGTFADIDNDGIWLSDNPMPSENTYIADDPSTPGVNEETWGAGAEIIVTLVVDHNAKELIADLSLAFAIDGTFTAGGITYNDLWNSATQNCVEQPEWLDVANRVLRARPTVQPNTPPAFIPANSIP